MVMILMFKNLALTKEKMIPDFILAAEDDEKNERMNARDDEDDPGHDSEQGNLEGAGNNMPHHQPKKPNTPLE